MAAVSSMSIISYDSLSANLSKDKNFRLPAISLRIGSILDTALARTQELTEDLNFPTHLKRGLR